MSSTPYNREFFDFLDAGSIASARVVLPELFGFYRPKSVIDIGCGEGAWLRVAEDNGVAEILGIDGAYVDCAKLLIQQDKFQACDLKERIRLPRRFDLAISLEVAEHLPIDRSETFVADLCQLSDVVLFSAATPYQGGTDHINEQWLEFWAILFRKNNYVAYDFLREKVWNSREVEFWYQQNLIVFANSDRAEISLPAKFLADRKGLSFIHPLTLLFNASRWRPLLADAMDLEFQDYRALLHAYTEGERELPTLRTLSARGEHEGAAIDLFPLVRTLIADPTQDLKKFYTSQLERHTEELSKRDEIIEHLRTYLEARTVELERRAGELDKRNEIIEHLRTYLEARTVELERRADLLKKSDEIIEQLRANLEARAVELEQRTDQLRDTRNDYGILKDELSVCAAKLLEQSVQIAAICEERNRTQENIRALLGSRSWKITAPLRHVAKHLLALRGISGL